MIDFPAYDPLDDRNLLFSFGALFSTLINVGAPVAFAVGGARLAWLFISPTPRAIPNTVRRSGWLTSGKLGLILFIAGCVFIAVAITTTRHLLTLPPGLWNIVPLVLVWLSALVGGILLASAIAVQSVLVDANRGLQETDWGRSTLPSLEGLTLVGLALALASVTGFRWLEELDVATADLPDLKQRVFIIKILFYWTLISAAINHLESPRNQETEQRGSSWWMTWFGWPLLLVGFGWTLKGVLPNGHEIERFAADPAYHLDVPRALWEGTLLALPGFALAVVVIVRLAARALPVRAGRKQPETWPAMLSCAACLMLATIFAQCYVQRYPAPDVAFDVWIGFALPLVIGMAATPLFGPCLRLFGSVTDSLNRMAKHNLFLQIVLWAPVAALVIGLLYVVSRLTALMLALAVLGWASAVASDLRKLPRRDRGKPFKPLPPETTT